MPFEEELIAARLATRTNMDAKLAASIAKFKDSSLKLASARPTTKVTEYITPRNTAPAEKKRATAATKKKEGPKCRAHTLEGRQCQFSATHGLFCKKHFSMM